MRGGGGGGVALLLVVFSALLLLSSNPANAQAKFYVGGDFGILKASWADGENEGNFDYFSKDRFSSLNIHVGARFTERFSAELGYTTLGGNKKTASETVAENTVQETYTELKAKGFNVDGFFHFPVGAGKLDALATAGVFRWNLTDKGHGVTITSGTRGDSAPFDIKYKYTGIRFGGGLQYHLNERFSIRGLLRYYPLNGFEPDDEADYEVLESAWDATIGFNFSF